MPDVRALVETAVRQWLGVTSWVLQWRPSHNMCSARSPAPLPPSLTHCNTTQLPNYRIIDSNPIGLTLTSTYTLLVVNLKKLG